MMLLSMVPAFLKPYFYTHFRLQLEEEKLKSLRLREQLESSLKREKQLRQQVESLLAALEMKSTS